jgi:hypothetical protein
MLALIAMIFFPTLRGGGFTKIEIRANSGSLNCLADSLVLGLLQRVSKLMFAVTEEWKSSITLE